MVLDLLIGFVWVIYLLNTAMITIFGAQIIQRNMAENKNQKTPPKKGSTSPDVVDDLSQFIEKKRIQNEALKKIVDKLNSNEKYKNDK